MPAVGAGAAAPSGDVVPSGLALDDALEWCER